MYLQKRGLFSVGFLVLGLAFQAEAQITLTDGNSIAKVDPNSQAGMFYWGVVTSPTGLIQNQLNKQWFWYGLGTSPTKSIDTLGAAVITGLNANTVTTTYTDSQNRFNIGITYSLSGGSFASGTADISEQIKINNTSGTVLPFHFFQYSDFNMGGDPSGDTGVLSKNGFTLRFNQADQVDGANLSEVVITPNANHGEVDTVPNTLNKLNGPYFGSLDDTKTTATGDVAWAFQWDVNINAGSSFLISKDKHLDVGVVPEPSTLALISSGLIVLALHRRRKRA